MERSLPRYGGDGLVNLVAEIEARLGGSPRSSGLDDGLTLPDAEGYVLMVFDGLGHLQLDHPAATMRTSLAGVLMAGFPTTTTTSLATIVTGTAPTSHGVIGHLLDLREVGQIVNTLKWTTPAGEPVTHDYGSMLPRPNLFERLSAVGVESITVQPGQFTGTPLSRMLYRSCRFEGAWNVDELVTATVDLAGPGRLVLTYFPDIDVAAHVLGQDSTAYAAAVATGASIWERLSARLPEAVGLVGTADHGHIDYPASAKNLIRDRRYDPLVFYGDPRSVYVKGPDDLIDELVAETGAESISRVDLVTLLGPGEAHTALQDRLPDRLLLAPPGELLLARPFDKRLIGYHGGLEPAEVEVPLLVR